MIWHGEVNLLGIIKSLGTVKPLGDKYHRLNALQYVRAICALGVVLFHAEAGANAYWSYENQISWFYWGRLGVPMFFCLSGFVISYSGYLRPKKSADFLFSRIARIYPAYLIVALLFIVCILVLPAGSFNSAPSLSYIFSLHRIADFLFGVSAFLIAVNPNADIYSKPPVVVLGVVAFAGLFVNPVGTLCAIFVVGMLLVEKYRPNIFGSKYLLMLGDSSYSIYLLQVLTVSASLKISKLLAPIVPFQAERYYVFYLLVICVSCVVTVIGGVLMRKHIEKPLFLCLESLNK